MAKAKHDTTRCRILNEMIEAETDDNIWPQYNDQLKALAENNLHKKDHPAALTEVEWYQ